MKNCDFCSLSEKIILNEFEFFYLVADPYPLCDGHMMIVAKEHYGCLGEMPLNKIEQCREILEFLKEQFPQYLIFEHGRAGVCLKNAFGISCDHMHVHFLPLTLDLHLTVSKEYSFETINQLTELQNYFHAYGQYVFLQVKDQSYCYLVQGRVMPPHMMRTKIAALLKSESLSNWENYLGDSLFQSSLNFLDQNLLSRCL